MTVSGVFKFIFFMVTVPGSSKKNTVTESSSPQGFHVFCLVELLEILVFKNKKCNDYPTQHAHCPTRHKDRGFCEAVSSPA